MYSNGEECSDGKSHMQSAEMNNLEGGALWNDDSVYIVNERTHRQAMSICL